MKKFKYVTALMAALGMMGGMSSEAWGQDNDKEEALPPLVFVIFDTSTSMHSSFGAGHNRLTKAIAEMAGAPKLDPPSTVSGYNYYLPRAYRDCSGSTCNWVKECKNMGGTIAKLPNMATGSRACTDYIDSFDDRYYENGVIHSYMESVKFGFAGMCTTTSNSYGKSVTTESASGYTYGVKINDAYKSSGDGIFTASRSAPAPTLYPTVSDDVKEIRANNEAVITSIRSYYATSGTPIGPALADMYYLFTTPDPGLVKQPIGGKKLQEDDVYDCRKKAVILISDGAPGWGVSTAGAKGQVSRVWEDAERLFNEGIRVYTVAYAQTSSLSLTSSMGKVMNWTAWKGGTCRDEHGNEIGPNDTEGFNAMVNANRPCMFNASDSNALRSALVTVLSDMLEGTKSKTSIATTTAIGQKENFRDGKWYNGYYNVYSGYKVTMGPVRETVLQRTAIICDHDTGEFSVDDNQYLDIGKRLKCRIRGKDSCGNADNIGKDYKPDGCVYENKYNYASFNAPEPVGSLTGVNTNGFSCLEDDDKDERYIFTANYVDVDDEQIPRYAISTFESTAKKKILKNISIQDDNIGTAGLLKKSLNAEGVTAESSAKDANFLLMNNTLSGDDVCSKQMAKEYKDHLGKPNYILSPYECGADFDCGTVGENNKPRLCDLGRCIDPGEFASHQGCIANSALSQGKVCIGNYWRKIYTGTQGKCSTHNDCLNHKDYGPGFVCHAGLCLPGTVKGCDVRHFMASIPLGTIEYATPVPVAPPTKAYKSVAYRKFSSRYWKRDSMLMVAANDGMLHAFVLGDNEEALDYQANTYDFNAGLEDDETVNLKGHKGVDAKNHEGDELWAFIPKMSYKNLYGLVNFGDQNFLNTKPVVADVQLPGFTIDGDSWRTVLVGGFRNGGRGYYALDITNPAKPFVLWEIDHLWQPWATNLEYPSVYENSPVSIIDATNNRSNLKNNKGYPFQLMGLSYAEPVITNMLIDGKVQPVAILAGGRSSSGDPSVDMVGRALYIVKLFPESNEDLLVKTFYFDEAITGTPEVYPNNFNTVAQHIYVGDAKGALYRLTVSSDFNSNTKYEDMSLWGSYNSDGEQLIGDTIRIKKDTDSSELSYPYKYEVPIFNPGVMSGFASGNYSSITFKPAVSLLGYFSGNHNPVIQITFGTGSNDNFNVAEYEKHYVASFVDVPRGKGYQLNPTDFSCFKSQVLLFNSDKSVAVGEKTDANYGNQKYTIYKTDPVSSSTIASYQKMTGAPVTHNFTSYFPTFVALSDVDKPCTNGYSNIWRMNGRATCTEASNYGQPDEAVQNPMNSDLFNGTSVIQLAKGTRVYGLELTNQMYCINDNTGGNHVLATQLIAQTGVDTSTLASDKGSTKLTSGKVEVSDLAINLEAVAPTVERISWASVYE